MRTVYGWSLFQYQDIRYRAYVDVTDTTELLQHVVKSTLTGYPIVMSRILQTHYSTDG